MNNTYERIVKFIDWNPDTDMDDVKLRMMQTFSAEEIQEAHDYAEELGNRLMVVGIGRSLAEINEYWGDSVDDCMSELVAHGEEYVQHIIENPDFAINRYKDNDYTENFFYVFPHDEDWDLVDASHYWKSVCDIKTALRGSLNGTAESTVVSFDTNMNRIGDVLSHEQVKMIADVLDEIWNLKWNSNRDYNTIYENSSGMGHGAWLANLWSDFGKYYAKVNTECVIGDGKYRKYADKVA